MRITTDLGELIRGLRDARGVTRRELAELAGVSISHLEKIEAGQRSPGMSTFVKIMVQLDVNISLYRAENTVHEKSMTAIQDIILGCTEGEANYLAHVVKSLVDGFPLLASGGISHLASGENDQSQPNRNDQCTSFSFL